MVKEHSTFRVYCTVYHCVELKLTVDEANEFFDSCVGPLYERRMAD